MILPTTDSFSSGVMENVVMWKRPVSLLDKRFSPSCKDWPYSNGGWISPSQRWLIDHLNYLRSLYLGPFDGDGGITLGFALQLGEFVSFGHPSHLWTFAIFQYDLGWNWKRKIVKPGFFNAFPVFTAVRRCWQLTAVARDGKITLLSRSLAANKNK